MNDIQWHIKILLFDIETAKLTALVEVSVNPADKIHKQLDHIDKDLEKIEGVIHAMLPGVGVKLSLLEGYEERINGLKMELLHTSQGILGLDHDEGELTDCESSIRDELFCAYVHVCDLFNSIPKEAPMQLIL